VGHVCPRKNQNAFIRALDSLAERRPFEVMFLGQTSPGRAYDDEFIGLVQSRRWCTHAGYAARDKLREYFRTAALVALPSLEDNCPMVVLEGMAAGVPVLAANVGGVPDLIKGDETGLLCDPLDAASMRNGVERALANPAESANLSRNARIWARKSFHPKVVAEGHLNIYREVLGAGA
jgi:glycosyltransferase involved in cell wall biosynthesis